MQPLKAFLKQKFQRVIEFLTSQGITMAGNLIYGILCVRLLPIPEYAMFVVVFGFLGTLSVLMDIGFSTSLMPLIGERIGDSRLIADYIASLRQLAHWLFCALAPAAIIVYPIIVHRQHWSAQVVAGMVAVLLVAAWCARVSGTYGAVLIVRRDRKVWYRMQRISSLGTLALLGVAWALHLLNGFCAILINVSGIVFLAVAYFIRARQLLGAFGNASPEKRKAIVHFVAPNLPNAIFYAVQGQLSLMLITYFGRASAVASVGALGRLAQVFVLFAQMSPVLIEPYFASLPAQRLKRNYLGLLASVVVFCGAITVLAYLFPNVYLWILGPKYTKLHYEVFLLIATTSMGYAAGLIWVVHNARRFVYWWNGVGVIIFTLAVQIVCIWKTDLSTISGVLSMNLWTATGGLAINLAAGIFGFLRGPRKIIESSNVAVERTLA